MTHNSFLRRLTAVILTLVMIVSMTSGFSVKSVHAADAGENGRVTWEKVENDGKGILYGTKTVGEVFEENYVKDGMVRASIVLTDEATLKNFPANDIAANAAAKNYREALRARQNALAEKISAEVLGGEKLDVVWNITLAANIISANIPYDKIEAIRNTIGVKDVVLETQYEAAVASKDETDPDMATASEMVGGNYAWAAGYTGAGSTVAIIDTGLDLDHQSFDGGALLESVKDKKVVLLEEDGIDAVFDMLNAKEFLGSADGVYRNAKVPYGVNYVDQSLDVLHINDKQGEHGSHVAGIAAANSLIPDGNGGYEEALDTVKTHGEAPDAQLLIMKVFGKGGGAYDSDYMVAIEDAIVLGADSVNLSLGSGNPGLVTSRYYSDIISEVAEAANLVWTNSAGNSYSWAQYSSHGYLYADDVSFATGGSPGTYAPTLSVASVNNKGTTAYSFDAEGITCFYNESSGYSNEPLATIAGEYEYVLLNGPGVDDNEHVGLEGDDFLALGSEVLEGKVAMCYRGSSSFFAKANAAVAQGAKAVVIINNTTGALNMNLTGYTYNAPVVSILQSDGNAIKKGSEAVTTEDGLTYYTGTIKISENIGVNNPGDDFIYSMSDFSAWGVPGDLSLKPEITAPGGNIYSIFGYSRDQDGNIQGGHDTYENMSGTSMAAPQVAGLSAVLAQYVRENNLVQRTGRTQRQLVLSLLMSTAEPMVDDYEEYFPVIQQGAGLANVNNAISAKSYITIDGVAEKAPASAAASISEGKVKIELGEVQSDSFTASFTIDNFSYEDVQYDLNADFFTQLVYDYPDYGYNHRFGYINYLDLAYAWTVDGEAYEPADAELYDFNGDGYANGADAQYLLDYCAGLVEDADLYNASTADFDKDGDIDTYDARLAFEELNSAYIYAKSGQETKITLTVSGLENAITDVNGNYIEGYIFVKESDSEDGAIGVEHSIPVLGFYGNWTDASMYDKGDVLSYYYGLMDPNEITPYVLGVTGGTTTPYVADYIINGNFFLGNPIADDVSLEDEAGTPLYLPERNAISSDAVVESIQYTQIRNAGAGRFFVTDAEGDVVPGSEMQLGSSYAAYYYVNGQTWRGAVTNQALNYIPKALKEDTSYVLNYQLAPEYYVNPDGSVRWDELGEGASFNLPFTVDNTAPSILDASYDEEKNMLLITANDNQWVAGVALQTDENDLIDYYGGFAELERGEEYTYEFDLSEVITGEEDDPVHFKVVVYDYAANLSTFKLNLNPEEADDPIEVKIDQTAEDAVIINNGTLQLTATVYPWGFAKEDVIWTSEDETLATVDENGLVTSVASEDATVKITATSVEDPEAFDSIEVSIVFFHKELNGIIWDEEGAVWMSEFDIGGLPNYTKLHNSALKTRVASAAYDENGTLYACTFDGDEDISMVYTVDEDTWTFTEVGESSIAYADFCEAPSLEGDIMLGVYGSYVVLIDKTTGDYLGAFNFTNYLNGANLVGIAYEEVYNHSTYGETDWVWLIDTNGVLYNAGFLNYNGDYANFRPTTLGQIGASVDYYYFQSLYYDGTDLYWSRFSEAENDVDLIMVKDIYNDGSIYNLGSFAQGVWPVGGVYEQGIIPYFGAIGASEGTNHSDAVLDETAVFETEITPVSFKKKTNKVTGSLNAAGNQNAAPDKVSTDVIIEITAEELSQNGMITVEVPETAELLSWKSSAQFKAWNDSEEGKYTFAFVDLAGILEDETILKLTFSKESAGTVTFTTFDINEDDGEGVVETVELFAESHHTAHTFGEPEWTWADDYSSAEATFTCTLDGYTTTISAVVTAEYEGEGDDRIGTYTATATLDGQTYTDTQTAPAPIPVITKQPENVTASVGTTVKLAVEATGSNLTYQWYYYDAATGTWKKSGATGNKTDAMTFKAKEEGSGRKYRCEISNGSTTIYTNEVIVTVVPKITANPKNVKASIGDTVTFTVKAEGTDLTYQWYYRDNADDEWKKTGATGNKTDTLTFKAKEAYSGRQVMCTVTSATGSIDSKAATLTVAPKITVQPQDVDTSAGGKITISVEAEGTDLSYQWYYRNDENDKWHKSSAAGSTTDTITFSAKEAYTGHQYRCKVTSIYGYTYTEPITITVSAKATQMLIPYLREYR